MPREDLEQYGSDSGTSNVSPDSDAIPNYHIQNYDPNAFSLGSGDDLISVRKFDGQFDSDHSASPKPEFVCW